MSPGAYAQETAVLEEVVVTAQKRSENLQAVPMSIQAMGTEKLQELNVTRFDDYAKLLPSVSVQSGGSGFAQVYFRGVASGDNINHSASQPSVGIYLDEQPVTTITGALDVHIYDIARVEALAGPQGTLYGASSQAGTIRIITNKPDTSGYSAGYGLEGSNVSGGDNGYVAEGFANLPLSDTAAIRLVGWKKRDAGWIDNVASERYYPVWDDSIDNADLVKKDYNQVDTTGGRVALKLDLNDSWTVTPVFMSQEAKSGGLNTYDATVGQGKLGHYFPERATDRWWQAALTVEGKIGDWNMTYAGAYLKRYVDVDSDYTDYSFFYDVFYDYGAYLYDNNGDYVNPSQYIVGFEHFNKLSHELRFSSPADARVRFVGGLFWQNQFDDIQQDYKIAGHITPDISVTGWNRTIWLTKEYRTDRDRAVFGELTVDATDKLALTGGVRYFKARNSLEGFFGYGLGYSSKTGEDACNGIIGDPRSQDEADRANWVPFHGAPCTNVDKTTSDYGFIHKLNATYKFDEDRLVYATWSRGYRPGGVNRRGTLPPYTSDYLTNYEFGWKTSWADNRVRFNGAIFQENWDDFQFSILGANGLTEIKNANQARIKGVEADVNWAVTSSFLLSAGATWLDPKLTANYCGYVDSAGNPETNCPNPEAAKGTQLPITSKVKGNLVGRYTFPLGGFDAHVQGTIVYAGKARIDMLDADFAGQNSPTWDGVADFNGTGYTDSFTTLDLAFGIAKDSYAVELFVNNVTDDEAVVGKSAGCRLAVCGEQLYYATIQPRVIALRFSQKF